MVELLHVPLGYFLDLSQHELDMILAYIPLNCSCMRPWVLCLRVTMQLKKICAIIYFLTKCMIWPYVFGKRVTFFVHVPTYWLSFS